MTEKKRYRCKNCGKKFEVDVLDERDMEEARRKNIPVSPIQCPDCNRTDVVPGWY